MSRPTGSRSFLRDLARAVSWHRRKLAVVAAVAAVITGVSAARPPDPPTVAVVRTVRQVPAGSTLSDGDVRLDHIPRTAAPQSATTATDAVVGKPVTGTLASGQVVTELDIGAPRASTPGMVVAPLRLTDSDLAGLVAVGDRVDVIASRDSMAADAESGSGAGAKVVASRVLVVGIPAVDDAGGLADGAGSGALLLVEVDLPTATTLSDNAASGRLSIVLR